MVYGYARVSTRGQATDGNGLEVQVEELTKRGCQKIYKESYTGTKENRPVLNALLSVLQEGDTLMVTKLDRIARSARGGIYIIDEVVSKGAGIEILNMGKFDNSPVGKLMRTVMFGFAEFERDMIVERTMEGKRLARANGTLKEGRPRKNFDEKLWLHLVNLYHHGGITIQEIADEIGLSRSCVYKRLQRWEDKACEAVYE